MGVKVGVSGVYTNDVGNEVRLGDKEYLIINEGSVLAVSG